MTGTSSGDGLGSGPNTGPGSVGDVSHRPPPGAWGRLGGPLSGRDITAAAPLEGQAPPAAPQPKHQPPKQAIGNRRSGPPSRLAVRRTRVT